MVGTCDDRAVQAVIIFRGGGQMVRLMDCGGFMLTSHTAWRPDPSHVGTLALIADQMRLRLASDQIDMDARGEALRSYTSGALLDANDGLCWDAEALARAVEACSAWLATGLTP